MVYNLHLQFHLKNPLCFLPCKVEVRTESGQDSSTQKEAEKVNIPRRGTAALLVSEKQEAAGIPAVSETGLGDIHLLNN